MPPARPLILATTLAALLACAAAAQTRPADAAPAGEVFDASMVPWDGDLSRLTPDQRREVIVRRARDAVDKRKHATLAKAGGRGAATAPAIAAPKSSAESRAAVAALADPDPLVRAAAREALMAVDAGDLPALRDALAGVTLDRVRAAGVRDAVVQSYLAGKHRFAGMGSPGYLGVAPGADENGPAIVGSRVAGWDGFRVLRNGDAIVGLRRDAQADPDVGLTPVPSFVRLKQLLAGTHPGDWVTLRVLRDGAPVEVHARLAMSAQFAQDLTTGDNKFADEADDYWKRQFAPALRFAPLTTRPVE